tara:strand:+ start:337 stop:516 length:180 start_codon:yes stop_codon:yes gene_type:complete
MPYHIKRRKLFQQDKFVYYCETNRWTEEYKNRKKFRTKKSANELMKGPGDWKRAEVEKY